MDTLNKCPTCGNEMMFNSTTQMWVCGFCSNNGNMQTNTNAVSTDTNAISGVMPQNTVIESSNMLTDDVSHNVVMEGTDAIDEIVVQGAVAMGVPNVINEIVPQETNAISNVVNEVVPQETNVISDVPNMVDEFMPQDTIGDVEVYICKDCGASFMADKATSTEFCVYCSSSSVMKERILNGRAPNYIIPFKTSKEDAINGFKKMTKGKLLMPRTFRGTATFEKITGVYVPFWAFDLEANGEVEFEASDTKYSKDSKYKYKKVDRFSIRKSGHFDFMKVLADASSRFPDDLIDSLEPYDYSGLTSYNPSYISGFLVEKYDVDEIEGLKRVTGKTNDVAVETMRKTVGHGEQKVINNGIRVSSRYTHYILLPVWMLNVKHKNKTYTFAMNGQTGKVIGNAPIGVLETIIWSIIFFIILFIIGFLFVLVVF